MHQFKQLYNCKIYKKILIIIIKIRIIILTISLLIVVIVIIVIRFITTTVIFLQVAILSSGRELASTGLEPRVRNKKHAKLKFWKPNKPTERSKPWSSTYSNDDELV